MLAGSAGLASRATYDYRLTGTSPAIDKGSLPDGTGFAGELPNLEYAHVAGGKDRELIGSIDLGAHEYQP